MKPFDKRIWLSTPTMHGDELVYINDAYAQNWMSTLGENIDEIESSITEKVGCKYGVALSSGTAALHLAVKLAGIKPGDKVFCTDMTFSATVNAILYEGADPIFIDSERETWNMDPIALEKAFELYPDTKAVIVINLYGTPAKYDELREVASRYGAIIIEDAAESFGSSYKGQQTGSFGKYNILSFNGNKIVTGSSGGMLLTNDKADAEKARKWSTQSRDDAPWYQHTEIGYNYRMSNVIAGVIRGQLPYLEKHIELKKAIYDRYKEAFKDLPVSMNPYNSKDTSPNFWLSCMVIDKDAMCFQERTDSTARFISEPGKTCPTEILEKLDEHKIEGRPIWKPMHLQPLHQEHPFVTANGIAKKGDKTVDVGPDIFERGLCLPSDIKMTVEEQNEVIAIVRSCFE